jgi:hypothetical protein
MNPSATLRQRLNLLVLAALAWIAVHGVAWAQAAEEDAGGGAPRGQMYLASYAIVVLCIGLGIFFVCSTGRRRDRPKGAKLEGMAAAPSLIKKEAGVPVITVGTPIAQVNKTLGKPMISRRGDDIFRELALAGKLSEEDAAKVHSIYQHPAGRYEIVSLEGRVIEIKTQPGSQKPS